MVNDEVIALFAFCPMDIETLNSSIICESGDQRLVIAIPENS